MSRRKYRREFKLEAVELLESGGRTAAEIERELGIGDGCLLKWRKQFAVEGATSKSPDGSGLTEREQIRRLKRENEILRQERDILKKAVAIFSQPRR